MRTFLDDETQRYEGLGLQVFSTIAREEKRRKEKRKKNGWFMLKPKILKQRNIYGSQRVSSIFFFKLYYKFIWIIDYCVSLIASDIL